MLFVAVAWLAAEALITLLVAAAALIPTLVGWRPAPAPVPPPPALLPPVPPLLGCLGWLDPAAGWSCCRPSPWCPDPSGLRCRF